MSADHRTPGWDWSALYRSARSIGISASAFWQMTPRELVIEFEVWDHRHAQQAERDYESLVVAAWLREYVHQRTMSKKRLESLRDYLKRPGATQTLEDQRAALDTFAAMYRIPVTRTEDHEQQAKG